MTPETPSGAPGVETGEPLPACPVCGRWRKTWNEVHMHFVDSHGWGVPFESLMTFFARHNVTDPDWHLLHPEYGECDGMGAGGRCGRCEDHGHYGPTPADSGARQGGTRDEKSWREQLAREGRNPTDCIVCGVGDGMHAIGCTRIPKFPSEAPPESGQVGPDILAEVVAAAVHFIAVIRSGKSEFIRENGRHGRTSSYAELVDAVDALAHAPPARPAVPGEPPPESGQEGRRTRDDEHRKNARWMIEEEMYGKSRRREGQRRIGERRDLVRSDARCSLPGEAYPKEHRVADLRARPAVPGEPSPTTESRGDEAPSVEDVGPTDMAIRGGEPNENLARASAGGAPPFALPVRVWPKPDVTSGMYVVVDALIVSIYMGPERECDYIARAINSYAAPASGEATGGTGVVQAALRRYLKAIHSRYVGEGYDEAEHDDAAKNLDRLIAWAESNADRWEAFADLAECERQSNSDDTVARYVGPWANNLATADDGQTCAPTPHEWIDQAARENR